MGAVASIIINLSDYASIHAIPFSALLPEDFDLLVSYINSTRSPEAAVLKTAPTGIQYSLSFLGHQSEPKTIFNQTAPNVVSFSGRGPNRIASDILKPDITAPGVEILAAYSHVASPVPPYKQENDTRRVNYAVLAGTSMACPHAAGVAAYLIFAAWPMNATGTGVASAEFSYGAGHVDPIPALNPGLVYELDKADYIAFLCGMNFNVITLKIIAGEAVTCTENILQRNLNYPSMSAKLSRSDSSFTVTFNRTVTNVGAPNSTYKCKVLAGRGSTLSVKVSPSVLSMKSVNEKQSFTVTVSGSNVDPELPSSASLIWFDGTHNVRSPIVVYTDEASY
ncbi:hypothetical protein Bca4012_045266 [Brassica carinata]